MMASEYKKNMNHPILFRVDDDTYKRLPSNRGIKASYCRKAIELIERIFQSPNQKQVIELLGYDINTFNIYEQIPITPPIPTNSKQLTELTQTVNQYKQVLLTFGDLFGSFNKMLKEKGEIDITTFKSLAPSKEAMEKLQKVMKEVRGGQP